MKDRFPLKKEIICRCTVKQLIRHLLTLRGTRTGSLYMVIGPNQKTSLIYQKSAVIISECTNVKPEITWERLL